MSSWNPQEHAILGWCEYQYEGPGSGRVTDGQFMVHATLEPGVEKCCSGFRVFIGCKNTQELAALVRTHFGWLYGLYHSP
jgi:hypothetical protein